jgi:hypothetical protein
MKEISISSGKDGSVFVVSMTSGVASVSAQDDVDEHVAAIATRNVQSAMRNVYSPAMGEPIAFAALVAAEFLKGKVVTKIEGGMGELEQAGSGVSPTAEENSYSKPKRKGRKRGG